MQPLNLKPSHKLVKSYYETLGNYGQLSIDHEMAVRSAFQNLLAGCGQKFHWTLVPEYSFSRPKQTPIRIDGALLDTFKLPRGYWEAKDEHDDLDKEIRAKLDKGYPRNNIIFQAPRRAVLYQHGVRQGLNEDIGDSANLVELLKVFFGYREPHYEEWDAAVADFKGYIPQIAAAVKEKIENQRRTNPAFVQRFDAFYELCRQSINPNLSVEAVETMLIQHLLTERIFRRIFDNADFTRRNVIAVEIEKIIDSMTAREFSRDSLLKDLDRFYKAIELAAETIENYSQKQQFLNSVYEQFFQGYSPKEADTHGIVYTPQPIVDFMVRSVEDILKKEFGRSLSDKDVHILDPFVGTGNFITRVMKEIKTSALPYKYESELHCNEVMLLPYYVASMNIEHEYLERTGEYKAFPGICLVDTFELAEPEQSKLSFMSEENTARVRRQKESPIFVAIGNPPYNVGQTNENDANKNRKYNVVDKRLAETYGRASRASSTTKLADVYVKAIRWASDRVGREGIVALVTNNGFIHKRVFDGMRKCLSFDFASIYLMDLGGDVRENPKLSGTTHNVFGIQPGVSINLFVLKPGSQAHRIYYARLDEYWRKEQKLDFLAEKGSVLKVQWQVVLPLGDGTWLTKGLVDDFQGFPPLTSELPESIFEVHSMGVNTNRDSWAVNFSEARLAENIERTLTTYNRERVRWHASPRRNLDEFLTDDSKEIKWSSSLKAFLESNVAGEFSLSDVRIAEYRPFTQENLYFNQLLTHRRARLRLIFPTRKEDGQNVTICVPGPGNRQSFGAFATKFIPALDFAFEKAQVFPFHVYDEDGSNRRENITDWALNKFRTHYSDTNITKWDIFHYVYAVLHHPEYRERYAANLKRELPRIPFVATSVTSSGSAGLQASVQAASQLPSTLPKAGAQPTAERHKQTFWAFVKAGRRLADLHVNYEQQPEYPLEHVEKGQLNWRVEKMRLGKEKTSLIYNAFLTLRGIPPETYEYRLGNRSALEWVIDQYQVSTDKRSGITNDPNRADDPEYIVRLIGQVITVSLETMKIVKALPELEIAGLAAATSEHSGGA